MLWNKTLEFIHPKYKSGSQLPVHFFRIPQPFIPTSLLFASVK